MKKAFTISPLAKKKGVEVRVLAFTLAEVLITLLIIGIVAALTIPSVISNAQQQEFKTGLKKAVSVLNEAIQTNIALEGVSPYKSEGFFVDLKKHMNVLQNNATYNFCYSGDSFVKLDDPQKTCGDMGFSHVTNQAFYTADGMRFELGVGRIKLHESDVRPQIDRSGALDYKCGSYGLLNNPKKTKNPPCVITVDVNGDKKPNPPSGYAEPVRWSNGDIMAPRNQIFTYSYPSPSDKKIQDIFNILITEDRAIPFGVVAQRAMYSK